MTSEEVKKAKPPLLQRQISGEFSLIKFFFCTKAKLTQITFVS